MYRNINLDKNRLLLNHFLFFNCIPLWNIIEKEAFSLINYFIIIQYVYGLISLLFAIQTNSYELYLHSRKFYILSPFVSFILNTTTTFHIIKVLTHKSRKKQNNNSLLSFRWLLRLIIDISLVMTLDLQTQPLIFL